MVAWIDGTKLCEYDNIMATRHIRNITVILFVLITGYSFA